MKNQKIWFWAAIDAVGVFVYVLLVALLLTNAPNIFGQMSNFWGPAAFLLLFVFSALVCGLLVFGWPVYLWFDGAKKDAVKTLLYTVIDLFVILLLAFLVNFLVR
jgi:hypothetical protein